VATALAHERDAAIAKAEPWVRHLLHQGVEPDAPVPEVCYRDQLQISLAKCTSVTVTLLTQNRDQAHLEREN